LTISMGNYGDGWVAGLFLDPAISRIVLVFI
jgi:hypothetical protein